MPATTSRLALPYPLGTDTTHIEGAIQSLADALDTIIVKWQTGTLATRPAAGNAGFAYLATDVTGADGQLGQWFLDNGTVWLLINPPAALASAVSSSAVGDSGVVGTSTSAARQDHVHGRESFAGAGGLYGSATSPARSDHSHSVPLSSLAQSGASSGQVALWNGSAWVPGTPSAGAPGTTVESYISADVGLTSGQLVAVTSVTLAAGTWLVTVTLQLNGSASLLAAWLGPNSAATTGAYAGKSSNASTSTLTFTKSITVASSTTVYLNAYCGVSGVSAAANTSEAVGNISVPNATGITAVRTA